MSDLRQIAAAGLILAVFVLGAGVFAAQQTLWVDETTQLSGIALPLDVQLGWLAGRVDPGLAVPPDRMPPLSYWIGEIWSAVFGLTETSMRWLGITCALIAAPALWGLGRGAGGTGGAFLALVFVFLAPGFWIHAVEIRTYPIFFALSAWTVWAFARVVLAPMDAPDRLGSLLRVGVLAMAASYAHFFGLLMAVCLFAALLVDRLLRRQAPWRLLGAGGLALVLAAGLVPFALSAVGVSGGLDEMVATAPGLAELLRGAAQLVLRLAVHGSHLAYPVAFGAVLLGLGGLVVLVFWGSLARQPAADGPPRHAPWMFALPIVLALVLLMAVDRALDGFPAFGPHYNLWMVPLAAGFVAFAFVAPAPRYLPYLAGAALIAGHAIGAVNLLRNPDLYSHGPGEWIARFIDTPQTTLVVHDGTGIWGQAYFPVVYLTEGAVTQILVQPGAAPERILPGRTEPIEDPDAFLAGFETVLLVSARNLSSAELGAIARGDAPCAALPMGDHLAPWRLGPETPAQSYCAFAAASLELSQR